MVEYAPASDEKYTIDDVRLFDETFLDINGNAFRKSLDVTWLDTLSGWRMGGGSTATDYLFLQTHLKLNHQLSETFYFGLDLKQDDFYTSNPLEPPLLFADVYPFKSVDIGISFLGTAMVDKRESDLGFAITLGRRPNDYVRFSWLSVDHYYNEKNGLDDSYYMEPAEKIMLEGLYDIGTHWEVYFDLEKRTPGDYVFDDQVSRFSSEFYNYQLSVFYHFGQHQFTGVNLRAMNVRKSLQETASSEAQEVDYQMIDMYWVNGVNQDYELTVGLRYDDFHEDYRDLQNQANGYDFQLWTAQAYSALYHSYSIHQAWDLGLYAGWSERSKTFQTSSNSDDLNEGVQAKLRGSWEYHSADKNSRLVFSFSLNLDDLIDDPTDGGGIYFQSQF
jgi:hypothetical protein